MKIANHNLAIAMDMQWLPVARPYLSMQAA